MPLANSFVLFKKKDREAYIQPIIEGTNIRYEVKYGKDAPKAPKIGRGANFKCICCGQTAKSEYIRAEFAAKHASAQLMAIVAEGTKGRRYFSPNDEHIQIANCSLPGWKPEAEMNQNCSDLVSGRGYGFTYWYELFTNRQLVALTTFSDLIIEVQKHMKAKGESIEYIHAVCVYLAFSVNKMTNYHCSFASWHSGREILQCTFGRQAIPMVWDYCEGNLFSSSSGSFNNMLNWVCKVILDFPTGLAGKAEQLDAQSDLGLRNILVSTDPPYYDNIGYADLSDFFYIWMRQSLKRIYPDLFRTMLVPKKEELTAMQHRFEGDKNEARNFFEKGMLQTSKLIYYYVKSDIPTTVYYAYRY